MIDMKKYTAREMMDRLHELNVSLYEQVLDTIADADANATGEWYDEEGHMVMVEIGDEE